MDDKTICCVKINGEFPIHMVSACSSLDNFVLGQVSLNEKTNKITAIPKLIENSAIDGTV